MSKIPGAGSRAFFRGSRKLGAGEKRDWIPNTLSNTFKKINMPETLNYYTPTFVFMNYLSFQTIDGQIHEPED